MCRAVSLPFLFTGIDFGDPFSRVDLIPVTPLLVDSYDHYKHEKRFESRWYHEMLKRVVAHAKMALFVLFTSCRKDAVVRFCFQSKLPVDPMDEKEPAMGHRSD